jgi:hypothetical protein
MASTLTIVVEHSHDGTKAWSVSIHRADGSLITAMAAHTAAQALEHAAAIVSRELAQDEDAEPALPQDTPNLDAAMSRMQPWVRGRSDFRSLLRRAIEGLDDDAQRSLLLAELDRRPGSGPVPAVFRAAFD